MDAVFARARQNLVEGGLILFGKSLPWAARRKLGDKAADARDWAQVASMLGFPEHQWVLAVRCLGGVASLGGAQD